MADPALPLVLCYHKVDSRLELGVTRISPRRFARQIERLADRGWRAITLDEMLAGARGERSVGEREVAITFDDAYRALREHAFPVLDALRWPATCSVITDFAGRLNRWDVAYGGRRFAHLAWRDMRQWEARGITFVSHTATHQRLTWCDELTVSSELARSSAALRAALDGDGWRTISYPFGVAGAREIRLARDAGYEAGLALAGRWEGHIMAINRLPVYPWALPIPGQGRLGALERWGAQMANRCAVGTSLWQRMRGTGAPARAPLAERASEAFGD